MRFDRYYAALPYRARQRLAAMLGVTPGHLSGVGRRQRTPSYRLMQRIADATKGKVGLADWPVEEWIVRDGLEQQEQGEVSHEQVQRVR